MRYNREKKELTFDEAKDKALRLLEFRAEITVFWTTESMRLQRQRI